MIPLKTIRELDHLKWGIQDNFHFNSDEIPEEIDAESYDEMHWDLYLGDFSAVSEMIPALMIHDIDNYIKTGTSIPVNGLVQYLSSQLEDVRDILRQFSLPQLIVLWKWQCFFADLEWGYLGKDCVFKQLLTLESILKEKRDSTLFGYKWNVELWLEHCGLEIAPGILAFIRKHDLAKKLLTGDRVAEEKFSKFFECYTKSLQADKIQRSQEEDWVFMSLRVDTTQRSQEIQYRIDHERGAIFLVGNEYHCVDYPIYISLGPENEHAEKSENNENLGKGRG